LVLIGFSTKKLKETFAEDEDILKKSQVWAGAGRLF